MTTIGRTTFSDNSATALLIAGQLTPTQVTLMSDGAIFMGTSVGLNPTTSDRDHLIYLNFDSTIPLQINLGIGDALYAVPYPGNGAAHVDWILT